MSIVIVKISSWVWIMLSPSNTVIINVFPLWLRDQNQNPQGHSTVHCPAHCLCKSRKPFFNKLIKSSNISKATNEKITRTTDQRLVTTPWCREKKHWNISGNPTKLKIQSSSFSKIGQLKIIKDNQTIETLNFVSHKTLLKPDEIISVASSQPNHPLIYLEISKWE